jgi:hypothetical protein
MRLGNNFVLGEHTMSFDFVVVCLNTEFKNGVLEYLECVKCLFREEVRERRKIDTKQEHHVASCV